MGAKCQTQELESRLLVSINNSVVINDAVH